MDALKMLTIACDHHALVLLNGTAAGETGGRPIKLFLPEGRLLLSFHPLCTPSSGILLPFSRLISFSAIP
ncbi:MAG: hypothetical protein IJP03_03845, partial [Christensenellaceae bacterium]|nr:hypothetical protein [Christensenellaceae bacterium]